MRRPRTRRSRFNTDGVNTWVWDRQTPGLPLFSTFNPKAPSPTYTFTMRSTFNPNSTYLLEDISGARATNVVGAVATNTGTTGVSDTHIDNAPTITPQNADSLILVATPIGHGPLTALLPPTPAGAIFLPVLYPEETDFDTMNNADGYGSYLNGADLSTEHWSWRWNTPPWLIGTVESWQAAAVEYRSAAPTGPALTVTKTHAGPGAGGAFVAGQAGSYTISVANAGPGSTAGATVTMSDPLPAGLTQSNVSGGADWNCASSTPAVATCTSAVAKAAGASFSRLSSRPRPISRLNQRDQYGDGQRFQ